MSTQTTAGKQRRGRPFERGVSGNRAGRPSGSRNRATVIADAIDEKDGAEIVRAIVAKAKNGDTLAARLVLDRLWPAPKGRAVKFTMPPLDDPTTSVLVAHTALMSAVSAGDLTIDEALALSQLLSLQLRMIETVQTERRLSAIEQQLGPTDGQ